MKPLACPVYFAVEASGAMMTEVDVPGRLRSETRLDVAARFIQRFCDAVREDPRTGDKVRLGVVSFSGEAQVDLPLVDPRTLSADDIPRLNPRGGGTSYASLFLTLRQRVESDVAQLRASGFPVCRPVVFLITSGGEPTDQTQDWQDAFKVLTDPGFRAYPHIFALSVSQQGCSILATKDQSNFNTHRRSDLLDRTELEPEDILALFSTREVFGSPNPNPHSIELRVEITDYESWDGLDL